MFVAVSKSVTSKQITLLKNLCKRTCLETRWNGMTVPFFILRPAVSRMPMSLQWRTSRFPCLPQPLHLHTAGTCPTRGRCPLIPEVSQPNPAAPSYSWERQTAPWSPPRERLLAAQFELLIQPSVRQRGWDCHHKMLHFASLAFGPKLTKCRGNSSSFHDIWIKFPTFNIK